MILGIIAGGGGGDITIPADFNVFPSMLIGPFSSVTSVLGAGSPVLPIMGLAWEDISYISSQVDELPLVDLPQSAWHQVNYI